MSPVPASFPATGQSPNTPERSGTCNHVRYHERHSQMTISPLAGKPAPTKMLLDPAEPEADNYPGRPQLPEPVHRAGFGTTGPLGFDALGAFTETRLFS